MASKNVVIAVALSILMIMTAGCAGWGTDSPANPDENTSGEVKPNESPNDSQETESDDSGTEEQQQDSEESSDTSTSTGSTEESSSGVNSDETDANGPTETDDGETVDETDEAETTDGTETDSSQRDSDQGDTSSSSNGDGSPAPGENNENDGEGAPENGESRNNGDTDDNENDENGANGNGDDKNGEQVTCEAFDTQEDSQEYFDENPEERGHLDENDDGIPCEHLPSGDNSEEPVYTLTVEADSPVTLERAWEDASTTREPTDGVVEFSVVTGEYTLSAEGYEDVGVMVENDRVVTMSPEEEQDVTITVTDEENIPIEGASVEVDDETKETNEDGTVQFSLIDGEYGVSVSVEGYQDESTTIDIDSENDTFSVSLEESNSNGGGPASLVVSNIHAEAAGDDHENLNDEYIELTNEGSSAITMTGWTLSDEANHVYDFPAGFTLEPDDSVTIYTGSGSDSDTQLYWNSGSAVWNNTGDMIIVINSKGETVIEREYSD